MKEIFLTIIRNRALGIVVLTFIAIITVIVVNISFNRQINNDFSLKMKEAEKLYKTQNNISLLERKLLESEKSRRMLLAKFRPGRMQEFEACNLSIVSYLNILCNSDSSSLTTDKREELLRLLNVRVQLIEKQLVPIKKAEPISPILNEQVQDNLMDFNALTESARRELSHSMNRNIRYLQRKIEISDQVNFLLVITAMIAAVFATTLTTQDFLRQKKIEQILRLLNDDKSKLFSILGHDLRSPLSGLNAIIYILKNHRQGMSEEDISDCIHQLEQTSSNYNKLLEDVLTWSRLQLNKIPIECQDLNVHILVKEISELYSEQVQKKKIWIHNQIPENLEIKSDKGMLQAVFRNLISNAIKFTSEGGDIWLHYRSDKAFHFIDVKDNGVGMSDAVMRTLFTNSTISMAGTNNEAGTGLGLSICKEFLSKDDAQLFVESVEGKGSIFTIALPLEETRKRLQKERKKNEIS
jgi:signal transduction histidine kinase